MCCLAEKAKQNPPGTWCFLGNHHLFTAGCILSAEPIAPPQPPWRIRAPLALTRCSFVRLLPWEKLLFSPLPVLFIGTASLNREKREKLLHSQGQRKTCVEGRQRRSLSHNFIMKCQLSPSLQEEPSAVENTCNNSLNSAEKGRPPQLQPTASFACYVRDLCANLKPKAWTSAAGESPCRPSRRSTDRSR